MSASCGVLFLFQKQWSGEEVKGWRKIVNFVDLLFWTCGSKSIAVLLCCRVPIWTYAKLMFNCWLVLPYFNGASYVYEHFVRPMVMNQQTVKIWYVPRKKGIFSKPDDVLLAAEKFLEENGPDAFQKLLNKVSRILYHYIEILLVSYNNNMWSYTKCCNFFAILLILCLYIPYVERAE